MSQIDEAKVVAGAGAAEDPVRMRCTIGSRVTEASAGICSSGTVPTFSSEDEPVETSSLDLIAPANLAVDTVLPITLRTQNNPA